VACKIRHQSRDKDSESSCVVAHIMVRVLRGPHREKYSVCDITDYFTSVTLSDKRSWGSSVSLVSDYRLDDRGSVRGGGKGFFL
jgi:hypothetical protein